MSIWCPYCMDQVPEVTTDDHEVEDSDEPFIIACNVHGMML